GACHLGLVGPVVDPERVLALGDQRVALLRDDGADDHGARVHQESLSFSCSSAFSEITSEAAPITSATPIPLTSATRARSRVRKLLAAPVSSASRTISEGPFAPHFSSAWAASLVEGVSKAEASRTPTEPRSACTERAERIARRRALRLTLTV